MPTYYEEYGNYRDLNQYYNTWPRHPNFVPPRDPIKDFVIEICWDEELLE